jgi:hypothetical protein
VVGVVLLKLFGSKASATRLEALERARARQALKVHVDPSTVRRPEHLQDRALKAHTVLWANNLPSELRPGLLLERYPHVANRLALCWADKALTNRLFEDLLIDKRGGRKGFLLRLGPNYCTCGGPIRGSCRTTAQPRVSIGQISLRRRRTGTCTRKRPRIGDVVACTSRVSAHPRAQISEVTSQSPPPARAERQALAGPRASGKRLNFRPQIKIYEAPHTGPQRARESRCACRF